MQKVKTSDLSQCNCPTDGQNSSESLIAVTPIGVFSAIDQQSYEAEARLFAAPLCVNCERLTCTSTLKELSSLCRAFLRRQDLALVQSRLPHCLSSRPVQPVNLTAKMNYWFERQTFILFVNGDQNVDGFSFALAEEQSVKSKEELAIEQADLLYDQQKFQEIYELLLEVNCCVMCTERNFTHTLIRSKKFDPRAKSVERAIPNVNISTGP